MKQPSTDIIGPATSNANAEALQPLTAATSLLPWIGGALLITGVLLLIWRQQALKNAKPGERVNMPALIPTFLTINGIVLITGYGLMAEKVQNRFAELKQQSEEKRREEEAANSIPTTTFQSITQLEEWKIKASGQDALCTWVALHWPNSGIELRSDTETLRPAKNWRSSPLDPPLGREWKYANCRAEGSGRYGYRSYAQIKIVDRQKTSRQAK